SAQIRSHDPGPLTARPPWGLCAVWAERDHPEQLGARIAYGWTSDRGTPVAESLPMLPREDDITGTVTHAHVALARPHLVAMWPGGSAVKELPAAGTLSIGRSRKCDLCIDHPSVSREQAVFYGSNPVTVEDLGSTNGTTIAGTRIPKRTGVAIQRGQVVAI